MRLGFLVKNAKVYRTSLHVYSQKQRNIANCRIIVQGFMVLPKVLSKMRLYITALDFRWTIRCVIAWYFLRNSRSLWVDSTESDRVSGTILLSSEKKMRNVEISLEFYQTRTGITLYMDRKQNAKSTRVGRQF